MKAARSIVLCALVLFGRNAEPALGQETRAVPKTEAGAEDREGQLSAREWIAGYSSLLGMGLPEAFEAFGVPRQVAVMRGEEAWQDDVVFLYDNALSLFWYRDRVWQIRFGPDFRGNFSRFIMGSSREEVVSALGQPLHKEENSFLYQFAGPGYPLRLRLFFGDAGLEDVYMYRGDF